MVMDGCFGHLWVLRLMYGDGWLYRAFMVFRVLRL